VKTQRTLLSIAAAIIALAGRKRIGERIQGFSPAPRYPFKAPIRPMSACLLSSCLTGARCLLPRCGNSPTGSAG
jgi:hypothetical protein